MDSQDTLNLAITLTGLCESSLLPYASDDWTPNVDRADPLYPLLHEALGMMRTHSRKVYEAPSLMIDEFRDVWKVMSAQPDFWLAILEKEAPANLSSAKRLGSQTVRLSRAVLRETQPLFNAEASGLDPTFVQLHGHIGIDLIARAYIEVAGLLAKSKEEPLILLPKPPALIVDSWQEIISEIAQHSEVLYGLDWRKFEDLVGHLLRSFGWSIEPMGYTKDGGIDIVAVRKVDPGVDFRMMVQCKRAKSARKIGVEVVRELWAVKSEQHFHNAMLATTSVFTKGAIEKAHLWDLTLKDHAAIVDWCRRYRMGQLG